MFLSLDLSQMDRIHSSCRDDSKVSQTLDLLLCSVFFLFLFTMYLFTFTLFKIRTFFEQLKLFVTFPVLLVSYIRFLFHRSLNRFLPGSHGTSGVTPIPSKRIFTLFDNLSKFPTVLYQSIRIILLIRWTRYLLLSFSFFCWSSNHTGRSIPLPPNKILGSNPIPLALPLLLLPLIYAKKKKKKTPPLS